MQLIEAVFLHGLQRYLHYYTATIWLRGATAIVEVANIYFLHVCLPNYFKALCQI